MTACITALGTSCLEDYGGAQMQFRRMHKHLALVLLGLTGISSLMVGAMTASADNVKKNPLKQLELARMIGEARAKGLRTSSGSDPETVWVGHVATAGGTGFPGD